MKNNFLNYKTTEKEISFYLIRHGESLTNLDDSIFCSNYNYTLTKKGQKQIEQLENKFISAIGKIDYIFCSDLQRARHTCSIITNKLNIPIKNIFYSNNLNELDIGEWNGKKKNICLDKSAIKKLSMYGKWFSTFKGESGIKVQGRIINWIYLEVFNLKFEEINRILVFTHGFWIKLFIQLITDIDYKKIDKIKIDHASVTLVKLNKNGWNVEYVNKKF